jgi:putative ABC transport system permease protein
MASLSSDAAPTDQEGPTVVTLPSLLVAAALLTAVFASTNHALGLGIGRDVALSAVRCAVQLSALGFALVPIFRTDFPPLSLAWALLMASVAALEASARPALRYPQMRRHVFAAVLVAAFLTLFWGLLAVLRVGLAARYTIPLLGMFLGNTSGSVAVALTSITTALADGAAAVEAPVRVSRS